MKSATPLRSALALIALLAACRGDLTSPSEAPEAALPVVPPAPPPASRGAEVRVERVLDAADGTVTFVVRMYPGDDAVSAFQGRVLFPSGSLELVSHTTPGAQGGNIFLANSSTAADGHIRFAAFTQSHFAGPDGGVETMRFTVRPVRPLADSELAVALDVVGTAAGSTVRTAGYGANRHAADSFAGTLADGCDPQAALWGDANDDGFVDVADAQQIARFAAGLSVVNPAAAGDRGDVTGDGLVNIVDAQQIARFGVGLSAAPRVSNPVC